MRFYLHDESHTCIEYVDLNVAYISWFVFLFAHALSYVSIISTFFQKKWIGRAGSAFISSLLCSSSIKLLFSSFMAGMSSTHKENCHEMPSFRVIFHYFFVHFGSLLLCSLPFMPLACVVMEGHENAVVSVDRSTIANASSIYWHFSLCVDSPIPPDGYAFRTMNAITIFKIQLTHIERVWCTLADISTIKLIAFAVQVLHFEI